MAGLKLARLEVRTPVRLTIAVSPQLYADLQLYARLYRDAYGSEESVADLVPSMLATFLASDRTYLRARAGKHASSSSSYSSPPGTEAPDTLTPEGDSA